MAESRSLDRSNVPFAFFPGEGVGYNVGQNNALRIIDVWAAVRVLAHTCASVPLLSYLQTGAGRAVWSGPPAPLLKRPAPSVTGSSLVASLVAALAVDGNAFLGIFRDANGDPAQLAPLDPQAVVVQIAGGVPVYRYTARTGEQMLLSVDDVIHMKMMSLDGIIGRSPIRACAEALGLAQSLTTHSRATFDNGALPAGVLTVAAGPNQQDTMDNLREGWSARHQGAANRGRVAVVSGDVSWQSVSMSLADSAFIQVAELSTRQVAKIFGIPSWAIEGETAGHMTYSTAALQKQSLLDLGCSPYLTQIEDSISAHPALHPPLSGTYSEFSRGSWLESDPKLLGETLGQQVRDGIRTPNEARALLHLPAHADGDTLSTGSVAPIASEVPG